MLTDHVLERPPLVLDQRARERYVADGFLVGHVGAGGLARLRAVVAAKIEDTGPEQGPLTAMPGTHRGTIFDQLDDDGRWTGAVTARDVTTLPIDTAVELCGPAGAVVLLDCRVVHGSAVNHSPRMRPLLLDVYAAADALPITPAPAPTTKTGRLVRGAEPAHVHMEPYPARLPPRWDRVGYRSIFAAQTTTRANVD